MAPTLAKQEWEACTSDDDPLTEAEYVEHLDELDEDVWQVVDEHYRSGNTKCTNGIWYLSLSRYIREQLVNRYSAYEGTDIHYENLTT